MHHKWSGFRLNNESIWVAGRAAFSLFTRFGLLLVFLNRILIFDLSLLLSLIHLLFVVLIHSRKMEFTARRRNLLLIFDLLNFMFLLMFFSILWAWGFGLLFGVLLFIAFEKSEVVLENGLRGDSEATILHILLNIINLILNAVFIFEFSLGLQMLEYFEDDLPLLFGWLFGTGLLTLLLALYLHQEVTVEILFEMVFKNVEFWELLQVFVEFLLKAVFGHFELDLLEVMLD